MGLISWGEAGRRFWVSSLTSHSAFSSLLCQICGSLQVLWILTSDTTVWATKSYPGFGVLILFPWILPVGLLFPIPVKWILVTGLDGVVTSHIPEPNPDKLLYQEREVLSKTGGSSWFRASGPIPLPSPPPFLKLLFVLSNSKYF